MGVPSWGVSRSKEISLKYLSARRYRDADYIALYRSPALTPIYKFRRGVGKGIRLSKCKLRRPPPKIVFPTSRRELPSDSRRTDARVGDDRSRSRWHSAQWLPFPSLLEKPFVSAYGFTALWFYHLNSASSDLFYHSRLPLCVSLSLSRALAPYLSVSVASFPSRVLPRPRAVAWDTT